MKHVLRYLGATRDNALVYKASNQPFALVGYCDASFAGDTDSRRSTSGYVFVLAGAAVSWSSRQQTIVATSTMDGGLIAAWEATSELFAPARPLGGSVAPSAGTNGAPHRFAASH